MPNDISTSIDGDLVITGGGLKIATLRSRDRNLMVTRIMTIRGELDLVPEMGVPDSVIGMALDEDARSILEQHVREALLLDIALANVQPSVRVVLASQERAIAFVQSNRTYPGEEGKMVVIGDYWHLDNSPITLLDGSEG